MSNYSIPILVTQQHSYSVVADNEGEAIQKALQIARAEFGLADGIVSIELDDVDEED